MKVKKTNKQEDVLLINPINLHKFRKKKTQKDAINFQN